MKIKLKPLVWKEYSESCELKCGDYVVGFFSTVSKRYVYPIFFPQSTEHYCPGIEEAKKYLEKRWQEFIESITEPEKGKG